MHHDLVLLTYILRSTDFFKNSCGVRKVYFEPIIKVHFSAAVVTVSMKPSTIIVLDTLSLRMHHDLVLLTYITCSTDFFKIYVVSRNRSAFRAAVKAGIMKPCIVVVTNTLQKCPMNCCPSHLHFVLDWLCQNLCCI